MSSIRQTRNGITRVIKADMSSGFASDSFLDFSKPSSEELLSSRFLALLDGKESIPCHIIKKRNEAAGVEGHFLLSPICFSGSQNIDFRAELEEGVLQLI